MAGLTIDRAWKAFGITAVLNGVSLDIADGEFCVIVGASGCGKSTLLRSIAGLEQLDSGSIAIGDTRVDELPPSKRGIAMVFQSYALYPHLSVYENMAFALRLAKRSKAEVDESVRRASAILGLDELLDRKPAALSGGQRQRVAIGRAIVRQPDVFLFDEPLSNLDASLRNRMRFEFAALHRQLGTTTVYVTHDQVEAMTLADRIVVMRNGVIEQAGTPSDLYERPANRFVAGFIGSPQMNFLDGRIVERTGGRALELADGKRIDLPRAPDADIGAPVTLGVRPEHWRAGDGDGIDLTARFIERLGSSVNVHLDGAGEGDPPLIWHHVEPARVSEGERVTLTPDPRHFHLFDQGGEAIRLS
ncbi:sn-glycerol-3-phosphate ABC transporter ATP-binding protein UgpC [Sphingomonas sp. LY29]|uniref:ABC transporter ATP-binding protein n=1 Tax=Sphingomonas sp. LY29 TaxID=3095341 RepID=UPI002D78C43B|nr:sn-glycerol-3-phosphate ABC transporter ATP-binding protein UgpC [Sphingomonas sp. LY29]WRP26749.1 sn-glycerol-3-phosphate ABC transporter ATP-binding protein UgpC [Sphingomonas sp. LY29]